MSPQHYVSGGQRLSEEELDVLEAKGFCLSYLFKTSALIPAARVGCHALTSSKKCKRTVQAPPGQYLGTDVVRNRDFSTLGAAVSTDKHLLLS